MRLGLAPPNPSRQIQRMCGIVAIAASGTRRLSLGDAAIASMRDTLARRGPDDATLWRDSQVALAHRRLAVTAPASNVQPLVLGADDSPQPIALVFNGEIYDPDDLRDELVAAGCRPTRGTDTELLALALARWGTDALDRLRGMFAFVAWLPGAKRLLVGRDALGVVPLHYALVETNGGLELVVASEPRAILAHPAMPIRPDWPSVANYLMTLRSSCGERTMFEGVRALQPGQLLVADLANDRPTLAVETWWRTPRESLAYDDTVLASLVRTTVEQSVHAHLHADVPLCGLLSGGLDSAILTACAREAGVRLQTFCAGAVPEEGESDLSFARRAAATFGTRHREAPIDAARFVSRWPWMVDASGLPLSTPNEVAIHAVGEALRPHATVALSGEGADELFAGYGPALATAEAWIARPELPVEEWHADTFAWVRRDQLPVALVPGIASLASPQLAVECLRQAFESAGDPRSIRAHIDVQRRLNLPTLLQRLNTSLMLASVEGRTPFADRRVAELAARLPVSTLYAPPEPDSGGGTAIATLPRTKRILRQAFADLVPSEILERPKASFPLPFERWMHDVAPIVDQSPSARAVFSEEARLLLRTQANQHWRLAWPLINVALWLHRWWD